jgi:hypothetical protein
MRAFLLAFLAALAAGPTLSLPAAAQERIMDFFQRYHRRTDGHADGPRKRLPFSPKTTKSYTAFSAIFRAHIPTARETEAACVSM